MNNFKGVGGGEGAEGGRKYCCWKLFILLCRLRHRPRNPMIYLISCRNAEEDSLSILVKDQFH